MLTDIVSALLYKKEKYCILQGLSEEELLSNCADALKSGISIIQFNPFEFDCNSVKSGHKLRQLCSIYDSLFIVKSRCDIANLTCANGVMLTNSDITPEDARKILNHEMLIFTDYISDDSDAVLSLKKHENIKNQFVMSDKNIYLRV